MGLEVNSGVTIGDAVLLIHTAPRTATLASSAAGLVAAAVELVMGSSPSDTDPRWHVLSVTRVGSGEVLAERRFKRARHARRARQRAADRYTSVMRAGQPIEWDALLR